MRKAIIFISALFCSFTMFAEEFKGVYINAFEKSKQEIHNEMITLGFSKKDDTDFRYEKAGATYGNLPIEDISFMFKNNKCNSIQIRYPMSIGIDNEKLYQSITDSVCKKYELEYTVSDDSDIKGFSGKFKTYKNDKLTFCFVVSDSYFYQSCSLFFVNVGQRQSVEEDI